MVPFPSSEDRKQLNMNQSHLIGYVKQYPTKLVRDVFSSEYGCKPSQWASLGDVSNRVCDDKINSYELTRKVQCQTNLIDHLG